MASPNGLFTDEQVKHLSEEELLELRMEAIRELLKMAPDDKGVTKLRDQLAKRYKIKTD